MTHWYLRSMKLLPFLLMFIAYLLRGRLESFTFFALLSIGFVFFVYQHYCQIKEELVEIFGLLSLILNGLSFLILFNLANVALH